jgi:hypothetical protein
MIGMAAQINESIQASAMAPWVSFSLAPPAKRQATRDHVADSAS